MYVDPAGVERSSKPVGAALVARRREGAHPGKRMRVAGGRHGGLHCEVLSLEPREEGRSERARVRLLPSHETVVVRCSELAEADGGEERPPAGRGGKRAGEERGGDKPEKRKRREADAPREPAERPWLVPNIR